MASYAKTVPTQQTSAAPASLPWATVAWFGGLLILCYAPILYSLVKQWANDEDMGHGFFVPAVVAFIIYKRRHELAALPRETNYWGLAVVLWSAVQMMLGTLGAEVFLARTAFIVAIAGAVLFLGGMKAFKAVAFPLFLLCFMISIPAIIYARITLPLQLFATHVAEVLLNAIGIPVLRDGNVLELANQRLSVVEACSGIRSLLSLSFLSLVYGYFFDSKAWMKWVLLAGTIPIAIAANASRVTLTGILSQYREDLARGFFHSAEGMVLFIVAFLLLIGLHQAVNRIYYAAKAKGAAHA